MRITFTKRISTGFAGILLTRKVKNHLRLYYITCFKFINCYYRFHGGRIPENTKEP